MVILHPTKFYNNAASCLENSFDRQTDGWTNRVNLNTPQTKFVCREYNKHIFFHFLPIYCRIIKASDHIFNSKLLITASNNISKVHDILLTTTKVIYGNEKINKDDNNLNSIIT